MQPIHLPALGPRYWTALCLASVFGANMGDFFAHNLGLGHVSGLPFLAAAFVIVVIAERFDWMWHQIYYWLAIVIVRTAATNCADFLSVDLKLPRIWVIGALTILLATTLWMNWEFVWRRLANKNGNMLRADFGYWVCMFIAGTLGTVIGDFCSRNLGLGDSGAAVVLSPVVALFFLTGRDGLLRLLPFYWLTVVAIRAAGTVVGDFLSGRNLLGLSMSTLATGLLLLAILIAWKEPATAK
jgi:uncharacterized membrane-anchored protein